MIPNDLERLLLGRYVCKVQKDEVLLQTCVYCANDRWNLELNAEYGVYHCWACKAKGTVRGFLYEQLGVSIDLPVTYAAGDLSYEVPKDHLDLEMRPVYEVESAAQYLYKRGLTLTELMKYEIKFGLENRILIPAREYYSQRLFGYVGRAYLGHQRPKYMATFNARMIAGYRWFRSSVHVLVEGLLDGIAIHRAQYNAAVMLGGASTMALLDRWASRIPEDHTILVLMDGDAQEKAEQICWRIKPVHVRVESFALPKHLDPGMLESRAVRAIMGTIIP